MDVLLAELIVRVSVTVPLDDEAAAAALVAVERLLDDWCRAAAPAGCRLERSA